MIEINVAVLFFQTYTVFFCFLYPNQNCRNRIILEKGRFQINLSEALLLLKEDYFLILGCYTTLSV